MSFGSDDQDIALPRTRPFPNRVSLEYSGKKSVAVSFFFWAAVKCWPVIFVTWVAGETHFPVLTHLMHIGKPKKEAGSSEKPKLRAASVKLISGDFGDSGTHTFNSL